MSSPKINVPQTTTHPSRHTHRKRKCICQWQHLPKKLHRYQHEILLGHGQVQTREVSSLLGLRIRQYGRLLHQVSPNQEIPLKEDHISCPVSMHAIWHLMTCEGVLNPYLHREIDRQSILPQMYRNGRFMDKYKQANQDCMILEEIIQEVCQINLASTLVYEHRGVSIDSSTPTDITCQYICK